MKTAPDVDKKKPRKILTRENIKINEDESLNQTESRIHLVTHSLQLVPVDFDGWAMSPGVLAARTGTARICRSAFEKGSLVVRGPRSRSSLTRVTFGEIVSYRTSTDGSRLLGRRELQMQRPEAS